MYGPFCRLLPSSTTTRRGSRGNMHFNQGSYRHYQSRDFVPSHKYHGPHNANQQKRADEEKPVSSNGAENSHSDCTDVAQVRALLISSLCQVVCNIRGEVLGRTANSKSERFLLLCILPPVG